VYEVYLLGNCVMLVERVTGIVGHQYEFVSNVSFVLQFETNNDKMK